MGAFANPFDPDKLLWSGCPCGQHRSLLEHNLAMAKKSGCEKSAALAAKAEEGDKDAEAELIAMYVEEDSSN